MPKLTPYTPQSEAELHGIIESDLDAIEEGIELLQHEYQTGRGFIDFLCIDSGKRLVIVEVKLGEDENVLFQALRYFSDIDRERYQVASRFPQRVDPEESPRLVLIAERFSQDLRRLGTLFVPEVELLEYSVVSLPEGEKAIVYHSASLPVAIRPPSEPSTIERLLNYLTSDKLKPIIDEMRNSILEIDERIQEYATQGYIGYKHPSGRQFSYIKVFRRELEIGAHIIDEDGQLIDYEGVRIKPGDEDYTDILEKMKRSFSNL